MNRNPFTEHGIRNRKGVKRMTKTHLVWREKTIGDTVIDGLIAGLVGGAVMALFLAAAGWLAGTPPMTTLAYFDPAQTSSWQTGLLAHLAVSVIYGALFGLLLGVMGRLRPSLLHWGWLLGLGYGLLLLTLARGIWLPAVASPILQITAVHLLIAHVVYGVVVGVVVGRKRS
jgi:hypothetical protein